MTSLFQVADGILDASEYVEENLSSVDSVQLYAEYCGIKITDKEASLIITVCRAWLEGTASGNLNGTNDFYHTVQAPLFNEE